MFMFNPMTRILSHDKIIQMKNQLTVLVDKPLKCISAHDRLDPVVELYQLLDLYRCLCYNISLPWMHKQDRQR